MPIDRHISIRYKMLHNIFNNSLNAYTFDELLDKVNDKLRNEGLNQISKRTLQYDINHFKEYIPFTKGKYNNLQLYKYAENDVPYPFKEVQDVENIIDDIINILESEEYKNKPEYICMKLFIREKEKLFDIKDPTRYLDFQDNLYLCGLERFEVLLKSIIEKTPIHFHYKPFNEDIIKDRHVHPYLLKQYNNNWYLLAQSEEVKERPSLYSIDRIVDDPAEIERWPIEFLPPIKDLKEYFDDVIGVTIYPNVKSEKIKLKVKNDRFPYINSKPIHPSQKELKKEKGDDYHVIQIQVITNHELFNTIFHYGTSIEVLEPLSLRDDFKKKVQALNDIYK